MKKLILLIVFVSMHFLVHSQNVNVLINNQETSTSNETCPYSINGICISEDVGGVDASIIYADDCTWVVFTNYNTFPVTILYEIGSNYENTWPFGPYGDGYHGNIVKYEIKDGTCGSVFCGIEGSKKIKLNQTYCDHPYAPVSGYRDESQHYSIKGMIVRKLSN